MRYSVYVTPRMIVGLAAVLLVYKIHAQSDSFHTASDSAKLAVTMQLDREVYFPGEDAKITIRLVNLTSQALEVFAPFDRRTGGVEPMERNRGRMSGLPDSDWIFSVSHPIGYRQIIIAGEKEPELPTLWLPPNQPMEKSFWFSEGDCNSRDTFVDVCRLSSEEGEYRIAYWNAHAQYRIVFPRLETHAGLVLSKPYERKLPDGTTLRIPRRVWVAVLGYEAEHFLVINVHSSGDREIGTLNGLFNASASHQFGAYRRIATTAEPVTSLRIDADQDENLTVTYSLASGASFVLKLDPNRRLLQ